MVSGRSTTCKAAPRWIPIGSGSRGSQAATFWIAAADERVKVAVPVSGMSNLEDYVGGHVVDGHCDCMFLINTYRWSWTQIAALVVPRPMLFTNSGHAPIFPMDGNDRIRGRLERLYGFYTNRTEALFDIGVTPGGVLAVTTPVLNSDSRVTWNIIGRGPAGVIGAYAAVLESRLNGVMAVHPTTSHRHGPVFVNVLRVTDIPEVLGMLAPRPLTIVTSDVAKFQATQSLDQLGGGVFTRIVTAADPVEERSSK